MGGIWCSFAGATDSVEKGSLVGSMFLQRLWKLGDKKEGCGLLRYRLERWVFHCRLPSGGSPLTPRK